jgi:hypothetical protein
MRVSHFAYIVVAITTFVVVTYLLLNDEAQLPNSPPDQLQEIQEFPLAEKPDRPPVRKEEVRLQEDDVHRRSRDEAAKIDRELLGLLWDVVGARQRPTLNCFSLTRHNSYQ